MSSCGLITKNYKKMKEAIEHSKITFENILKQWHNLTDKQRQEIQSNIDYLNEQLTLTDVSVMLPNIDELNMDKYEKLKKKFAGRKPLTDEEVQELRDKAKKYRDSGGEYLERCETK